MVPRLGWNRWNHPGSDFPPITWLTKSSWLCANPGISLPRLSICQGTLFKDNSALWISLGECANAWEWRPMTNLQCSWPNTNHYQSLSVTISHYQPSLTNLWPWTLRMSGAGLLVSSISFAASRGEQKSAFLQVSCVSRRPTVDTVADSHPVWTYSARWVGHEPFWTTCNKLQRQNRWKGYGPWWNLQALIVLPFVLAVVDFSELLVTHILKDPVSGCVWKWAIPPRGHTNRDNDDLTNRWI